jgi:formamidopyrimidine-DNA glycosylase
LPELPEVETLRRDLAERCLGWTLERLALSGRRTVRRHPVEALAGVEGQELVGVDRHGKFLLLHWGQGDTLVVHLRMSGQLLIRPPAAPQAPHTHAVFAFATPGGGQEWHFVDPRTFGELFLLGAPGPGGERAADGGELGHLGPDGLAVTAQQMTRALAGRRAPLKSLLVDQRVVAGIGNIYADEICFEAKLRPDRPAGRLRPAQVARLTDAIHAILRAAVLARGSSLADEQYRDVDGRVGRYQLAHRVYARAGMPCPDCGRPIDRVPFGARSAFLCRRCQR